MKCLSFSSHSQPCLETLCTSAAREAMWRRHEKPGARGFQIWTRVCAALLLCVATAISAPAQTFTVLRRFSGGTGGSHPTGPLLQSFDGRFYGATNNGGTGLGGTAFSLGTDGTLRILHSCCAPGCTDGAYVTSLLEGAYGTFYGTDSAGGVNYGDGMVFEMTPSGSVTPFYAFCSLTKCEDGRSPSSLVKGFDGSLHGTTATGGLAFGSGGGGTIFRLTPGGAFSRQKVFCRVNTCPDGAGPASLFQGADGNLYGFTEEGGNVIQATGISGGTIFSLGVAGFKTVYLFCSQTMCADGSRTTALLQGTDGNLYGVTAGGGDQTNCSGGCGTIFKLTTAGTLTTLHTFCAQKGCPDGFSPSALVQGTDGNFYGTTGGGGGSTDDGTVFEITPGGTLTTLHVFSGPDGNEPEGLTQGTDGAFYGTTASGGNSGFGVAFRLDVGLGPFVRPVLTFGKVGDRVTILGSDLTGATAVTFDGTAATFHVASSTAIVTTVPEGATTGTITVTTPSGPLDSNVAFTVLP